MALPKAHVLVRINENRGFSIMELIVVVTLITTLATAVLLMVQGQTDKTKLSSVANTARMINEAASAIAWKMEFGQRMWITVLCRPKSPPRFPQTYFDEIVP